MSALVGGALAGLLYRDHVVALSVGTVLVQALSYVPLRHALRAARTS